MTQARPIFDGGRLSIVDSSVDQIETFLEARGFTTGDLVVDELVQQNSEDVYVDDSEDDLSEWQREEMGPDEELNTLMHFVFASDSGTEDLVSPETEVTFTKLAGYARLPLVVIWQQLLSQEHNYERELDSSNY